MILSAHWDNSDESKKNIIKITGYASVQVGYVAREVYASVFNSTIDSSKHKDESWATHLALAAVWVHGYTQGVRAEREKKQRKMEE